MSPKKLFLVFCTLPLFVFMKALASPCCGQNSASLNVMTLHQGLSLSLAQTQMQSVGRVFDSNNDFFVWPDSKTRDVAITQISAAMSLNSRLQLLLTSSWQSSNYRSNDFQQSAADMMDTVLGVTFDVWPEYTFSYYKPNVYVTVFANVPTGRSVFEGQTGPENIAVTGHGQWGAGVGLTLQKSLAPWSVMMQMKSLHLLSESWSQSQVDGFYDSSFQMLVGYSLPFWDLNLNFAVTQLELSSRTVEIKSTGTSVSVKSPNSRSTLLGFGLSRMFGESVNLALNFSDQTLLGKPKNTLLAQGVSFVISYNKF